MYIATYLVQAIVGLSITFLLLFTIREDPLRRNRSAYALYAFGMNPGNCLTALVKLGELWVHLRRGKTTGSCILRLLVLPLPILSDFE